MQNLGLEIKCLLSKFIFKLCNEEGQNLLRNQYLRTKILSQVKKSVGVSHLWMGFMRESSNLMFEHKSNFGRINGCREALKLQYPNLSNIVHRKHATLAGVVSHSNLAQGQF